MAQAAVSVPVSVAEQFQRGIQLARAEKWHEAYDVLIRIAQQVERRGNLPGVYYSYLALAMAHCDGQRHEAMELCRYALRVQPDHHENYLNQATLYLMLGRRESAVTMVRHGLAIRPDHPRLRDLQERLGVRQPPTFPMLSRRNPLNSLSGRMRAWARRRRDDRLERQREIAQFGA